VNPKNFAFLVDNDEFLEREVKDYLNPKEK
jgi:hypothetical protein